VLINAPEIISTIKAESSIDGFKRESVQKRAINFACVAIRPCDMA
jgi:hypothetical protein